MAVAFVFALSLPFLVLPVGSELLAEGAGQPRLSGAAQLALKTGSTIDRTRRLGIYALGWLAMLAWGTATLVVLGGLFALSGTLAPAG